MSNVTIIGFDEITATIAIGLKVGCLNVDDTASLELWEQSCDKYREECVTDKCGGKKFTKVLIPKIKVSATCAGKDSNGRAVFNIPQEIKSSPSLYWAGEMTMCGSKVSVHLQRNSRVSISSTATSFVTGYADYIVDGVVVGKVGLISRSCLSVPKGWVSMKDPLTGVLVGYAPTFKGDGFCKPFVQTAYGCSHVWLA